MNYFLLRVPKNHSFKGGPWQTLIAQLQWIYGHSPVTYHTEYSATSVLIHPIDRKAGAVFMPRSGIPGTTEFFAEPGHETADHTRAALLIGHHSQGRVQLGSTLHRQRTVWEQAEASLKTLPGWDPRAYTRRSIGSMSPTQIWSGP